MQKFPTSISLALRGLAVFIPPPPPCLRDADFVYLRHNFFLRTARVKASVFSKTFVRRVRSRICDHFLRPLIFLRYFFCLPKWVGTDLLMDSALSHVNHEISLHVFPCVYAMGWGTSSNKCPGL